MNFEGSDWIIPPVMYREYGGTIYMVVGEYSTHSTETARKKMERILVQGKEEKSETPC